MKRDQLKELSLTDEQINAIMSLYGQDIEKAKAETSSLIAENEALKKQTAEFEQSIKDLKKNAKSGEDLTSQIEALQEANKKQQAEFDNQVKAIRLESAVKDALTAAKVRNPKTFKGLLDMDKVALSDDGTLTGLDDQLAAIKQSDAYLFDEGSKQNYTPNSGKPAGTDQVQAMVDAFKGK